MGVLEWFVSVGFAVLASVVAFFSYKLFIYIKDVRRFFYLTSATGFVLVAVGFFACSFCVGLGVLLVLGSYVAHIILRYIKLRLHTLPDDPDFSEKSARPESTVAAPPFTPPRRVSAFSDFGNPQLRQKDFAKQQKTNKKRKERRIATASS